MPYVLKALPAAEVSQVHLYLHPDRVNYSWSSLSRQAVCAEQAVYAERNVKCRVLARLPFRGCLDREVSEKT